MSSGPARHRPSAGPSTGGWRTSSRVPRSGPVISLRGDGPSAEVGGVVHEAARAAAARGAIGPAAGLAEQAISLTPTEDPDLFQRRLDASAYEIRGGETARPGFIWSRSWRATSPVPSGPPRS